MPILLLILLLAVLAYMWWERSTSGLTRACRWRQERAAGQWRCAACGGVVAGTEAPRICLRKPK